LAKQLPAIEINTRLKQKGFQTVNIPIVSQFFQILFVEKRNAVIRKCFIFVHGAVVCEANVNKRLQINIRQGLAKKYYEKGRFFLEFGTAFG
jgi:hypothetical protein